MSSKLSRTKEPTAFTAKGPLGDGAPKPPAYWVAAAGQSIRGNTVVGQPSGLRRPTGTRGDAGQKEGEEDRVLVSCLAESERHSE